MLIGLSLIYMEDILGQSLRLDVWQESGLNLEYRK